MAFKLYAMAKCETNFKNEMCRLPQTSIIPRKNSLGKLSLDRQRVFSQNSEKGGMHLLIQLHTLIQFQNHNSAVVHFLCASLPFSPSVPLKRRAGRKHVSEEAISSPGRSVDQAQGRAAGRSLFPADHDFLFLHQNDYWIIRYDGHTAFLKSTRGLQCLAILLHDPGREFHVRDLFSSSMDVLTLDAAVTPNGRARREPHVGIPILDAKAKAEYKRRLNELQQALGEAERLNDPQRKTEAQTEIQAITDYLASAVGLGGRDRRASSDAERARSAVTKCIRKDIQKISSAIPSLGYHLATRIKTGYFCAYHPHPDRPVAWKF
jgi:non-specific serine/threonine protein kinase